MPGRTLMAALLLSLAPLAAPAEEPSPDETLLREAGAAVDGGGLLAFFRQRTPPLDEIKRIGELIHQLGSDDFDDRESASATLRKAGAPAAPLLRAATRDADVEVARRAERALKDVGEPPTAPALAAARLLARRAPDGAVPVLLAYLPFAGDDAVEEEVLAALLALTPSGKADPALAAALDDPLAVKRAAAAHVLGRKGDKDQRAAVRKRLADADAHVRWRAAVALLAAQDRAGATGLLGLLADGPPETAWRAEELLRRMAGDKAPAVVLGDTRDSRRKCRDAWAAWWKDNGAAVDLAHFEEGQHLLGFTLGIEYNTNRVWECNPDGSGRWEVRDLVGPMDAQMLPNGRVLIAEAGAHRITERDPKGEVRWEKKIDNGEPTGCQRLPDGSTFVCTYSGVMEFAADGTKTYGFAIPGSNAIRKLRNGHVAYTQDDRIVEVDTAGKPVRTVVLPTQSMYVGIDEAAGDHFVVANSQSGRVLEVDAAGKVVWEANVPTACGVARLPNGHTLVAASGKVVELDAAGKSVWEKAVPGYARRVHRR